MSQHTCVACEYPIVDRAKEHVIPEWLLKALDVQYEELTHAVAAGSEEQIQSKRSFTFDSFQEGRICEGCNGGWMGRLEREAGPILIPLMEGRGSVSSLTEPECLVVSRWAAKTAAILSNSIKLGKPAPAGTLRFLKDNPNQVPDRFGVFGSQQPIRPGTHSFTYLQRNSWVNAGIDGAPNQTGAMLEGAFKVGIQLRGLYLLTAYLPVVNSKFLVAAGLHIPLWPRGPLFAAYKVSLDIPEPYDSYSVLKVFTHTLGAMHPPTCT
jgi:hypothetical protein